MRQQLTREGALQISPTAQPQQPPASDHLQNGKHAQQDSSGGGCFRWLLVIIAFPILAILSVIGIVIWIVLLPVKIICCPVGCVLQIMANAIEYMIKAPFKGLMWASGKPWESHAEQIDKKPPV